MENKKSYYAIIPADVRYDKRLTANAKLLYGEITALCNEKGYCWATNLYFAKLYNVSKTSISKWINQLKNCNYVDVDIKNKTDSKEILYRYIRIVKGGIEEKLNTPIEEKLKENNTVINNTINNKKEIPENVIHFTNYFFNKINDEIKPARWIKKPPDIDEWYIEIDRMNRRDKVNIEDMKRIFDFAIKDKFWFGVFITPEGFRRNYDKIEIQMRRQNRKEEKWFFVGMEDGKKKYMCGEKVRYE